MPSPFVTKLKHGADLTDADCALLDELTIQTRRVGAREDLIRQGDRPDDVHLVMDGFACRYKVMEGGARLNMAYLVPGDFCDLHVAILDAMDHGIATLSPCTLVDIPRRVILELTDNHPRIARALWWCTLVDEGTLREWLVNLGRREANQRMAHLFCELHLRLRAVGLAGDDGFDLPLTQAELGDTIGVSNVHVNRTIQQLREARLVTWQGRRLTIPDVDRLRAYCDFEPAYLHLSNRRNRANSGFDF